MNHGKWISAGIFGVATQVVFWITYTSTDNIVSSIGITGVVFIIIGGGLSWLGKRRRP